MKVLTCGVILTILCSTFMAQIRSQENFNIANIVSLIVLICFYTSLRILFMQIRIRKWKSTLTPGMLSCVLFIGFCILVQFLYIHHTKVSFLNCIINNNIIVICYQTMHHKDEKGCYSSLRCTQLCIEIEIIDTMFYNLNFFW